MDFQKIFFGKFFVAAGIFDDFREQNEFFSETGEVIGVGTARLAFEFGGAFLNFFNGFEYGGRFGIDDECGDSFKDFGDFFELAVLLQRDKALIEYLKFSGTCRCLELFHGKKFFLRAQNLSQQLVHFFRIRVEEHSLFD